MNPDPNSTPDPDSTPIPAMNSQPEAAGEPPANPAQPRLKVFGIGTTGMAVLDRLGAEGMPATDLIAVNTDHEPLDRCSAGTKIHIESRLLRGLGSGGDPERTRA